MHTIELIEHNIQTLKEADTFLNGITDEQYSRLVDSHSSASIGKHLRHVIDHYICLFVGLYEGNSTIDYDARIRDQRYESDQHSARQKLEQICSQLEILKAESGGSVSVSRKMKVICSTSTEQSSVIEVDSNLERELIFLHSHTVHHFALISMILQGWGITMETHFGIAPSTVKHLNGLVQV